MIVTFQIDGDEATIETGFVTGADAIEFERSTGAPLEAALLAVMAKNEAGTFLTAVDRSVLRWLWVRQTIDPEAGLEDVARMVPLWEQAPSGADVDAPEPEPAVT